MQQILPYLELDYMITYDLYVFRISRTLPFAGNLQQMMRKKMPIYYTELTTFRRGT